MKKINLLLIFGGKGGEHEISCVSCGSVLDHIDRNKYNIFTVGIKKDGSWIYTKPDSHMITTGRWEFLEENKLVSIELGQNPYFKLDNGTNLDVDCVFPMIHGIFGEDGRLQGLLDIMDVRYVGSKVLASAIAMDKGQSKKLSENIEVGHINYTEIFSSEYNSQEKAILKVERDIGKYPMFVKPANTGSSVGISKAHNRNELRKGIDEAFKIDKKVIVEETIVGREFEVAVMGNESPVASVVGEVISSKEFYDYEAKYNNIGSMTKIVDDVPKKELDKIREKAIELYNLFDCKGLSRVDFFYTNSGDIYFIEVNTLPGFTPISMYPKLWEESGINYSMLIDMLIDYAMEE